MAMTNAERQRKFRKDRERKGLVRRDEWTNRSGLIAPESEYGGWAMMPLKDMNSAIKKLIAEYDDVEQEMFYAELFEHAKKVEQIFTPLIKRMRKEIKAANVTGNVKH